MWKRHKEFHWTTSPVKGSSLTMPLWGWGTVPPRDPEVQGVSRVVPFLLCTSTRAKGTLLLLAEVCCLNRSSLTKKMEGLMK